ncbi:membrane protein [Lentilactobacillus fungorum]|uniref:Membrane protein n=1 Tax=Lentilactobacillus fungorum TaxID=2201250 RepID=A0ABQ3W139_9LACO|nr:PH domain-containing protein [Lentilactobacillus fungorum]GHP14902.1 membrane protein [Lentilactobacillus fungorum]
MTESNHLPTKIKTVWRISAVINFLILAAIGIGAYIAFKLFDWHWLVYGAIGFGALALIDIVVELSLVPYRYSFWLYTLTDDAVELRSGFIFRRLVSIPIARVQDVTLSAGPILQSQKLQEVRIATASTSHKIDGLQPEVGEQLRKQIMALAVEVNDHDV